MERPRLSKPSTQLARYDAMVLAIADAHEVDEVKDIRDKAVALEAYSKQARNTDNERYAAEIRIRAERKAGELSKQLDTAQGARIDKQHGGMAPLSSTKKKKLEAAHVSVDQARRWEKLADVPERLFERSVTDRRQMPTTTGILRFADENAARHRRQEPKPLPDAGEAVPKFAEKIKEVLRREHPWAAKIEDVLKAHEHLHPHDVSMLAGALRGLVKRAAGFAERLEGEKAKKGKAPTMDMDGDDIGGDTDEGIDWRERRREEGRLV